MSNLIGRARGQTEQFNTLRSNFPVHFLLLCQKKNCKKLKITHAVITICYNECHSYDFANMLLHTESLEFLHFVHITEDFTVMNGVCPSGVC